MNAWSIIIVVGISEGSAAVKPVDWLGAVVAGTDHLDQADFGTWGSVQPAASTSVSSTER